MLEIIRGFISNSITFISVYVFGRIVFEKKIIKRKNIFNFLLMILIISSYTAAFLLLDGMIKTVSLCVLYMLTYKILFDKTIGKGFISSIIYTVLLIIPELITMVLLVYVMGLSKEYIYNSLAGGIIINIIVNILMTLLVYLIKKPLRKLLNINISTNKSITITSIITILFVTYFFYKYASAYRIDQNVIVYIIAMLAFSIVLFFLLKQKLDNDKIAKKYDELLDIMKNYESDIEEQRTLIHETRNELTTIRSKIKDKEKESEIIKYIDSIMGDKVSSKMTKFSKFKYLPSNGLKGFFYYKFTEAERKGINISVNISKQIENSYLNQLDTKNFKDLARVIGVYLDNAIEASYLSDEKKIGIEIYIIKNNINIIISNTYANKIDEDKVGIEKYSTKGKNRGHGLLLVKRILGESKIISSDNKITESLYIQKIIIKKDQN